MRDLIVPKGTPAAWAYCASINSHLELAVEKLGL